MLPTTPFFRFTASFLLGLALVFQSGCMLQAASRSGERPESWVSADALMLVHVPELERTRARWPETAAARAWGDPASDYWRSGQFDVAIGNALGLFGVGNLQEFLRMAQRNVTVVLEGRSGTGSLALLKLAIIARIDFGANAAQAAEAMRAWPRKVERQVRIAGHDITLVTHGGEMGGFAPSSAWVNDVCWIASSEQALDTALKRALGEPHTDGIPLGDSPEWNRARAERRAEDDAFAYINVAKSRELLTTALEDLMKQAGQPESATRVQATMDWIGLQYLQAATINVELRGPGIYQRSAMLTDGRPKGLLYMTQGGAELRTPRWMTSDVASFSAMRMVSLYEWKSSFMRMLQTLYPETAMRVADVGKTFRDIVGVDPDTILQAFGPEFATVSRPGAPLPDITLLLQIRDAAQLKKLLDAIRTRQSVPPIRKAYKGCHIEAFVPGGLGFYIYVAEVEGFLTISSGEGWLRSYLDQREKLATTGQTVEKSHPMGATSLLPLLRQPFNEKATPLPGIVGRSYDNPGPALLQINASLPLAVPFLNMMLQQQGVPAIPDWVVSTFPPLLPFATNAFPTVERSMETRRGLVTERYSAYKPFASPITAAAVVIGLRLGLDQARTVETAIPK